MRFVSKRRVLLVTAVLLASMIVPAAPGMAAELPPPETVVDRIDGLAEQDSELVDAPDLELDAPDRELEPQAGEVTAPSDADGEAPSVDAESDETDAADGFDVGKAQRSTSQPTATPIPFSMIGFGVPAGVDEVEFRTNGPDGWTDWQITEVLDVDDGPDPGSDEGTTEGAGATDPVWVGEADEVQIRVLGATSTEVEVHVIDSMGLSETFFAKTARYLRARPAPAEASVGRPPIVTRQQWGANESWRSGSPRAITPRYAVVHHTAGNNNYSRAEAPGVVRGIYSYHARTLGWNDVGYNIMVDRYGTIYEGRFGGLERGIQGAHASGHNADSFGVSLIGNFDIAAPPAAAIDSMIDVIAWKFDVHGISADPNATVRNAGTNNRTVRTIVGHRDVGSTACPGRFVVSQMGQIRDRVAVQVQSSGSWVAVSGDWNGDGRHTPGWFANGRWYLQSASGAVTSFSFGGAGDVPITGDWNGNGRYGVGIVRNGRWHLRNTLSGGSAELPVFTYGRVNDGDVPITGDWNGDGRYGVGIVRNGRWHLRQTPSGGSAQLPVFTFGRVLDGDIPFAGDWNGNGRYGIGIVRNGRWHLRQTPSGGTANIEAFTFGRVNDGDQPVVGDWNRNGRHGIGIARGAEWHLRNSLSGGGAQVMYTFGGS